MSNKDWKEIFTEVSPWHKSQYLQTVRVPTQGTSCWCWPCRSLPWLNPGPPQQPRLQTQSETRMQMRKMSLDLENTVCQNMLHSSSISQIPLLSPSAFWEQGFYQDWTYINFVTENSSKTHLWVSNIQRSVHSQETEAVLSLLCCSSVTALFFHKPMIRCLCCVSQLTGAKQPERTVFVGVFVHAKHTYLILMYILMHM